MTALRRRNPGFTLIEIVVVLLIVAVATAFALPNFLAPRDDDDLTAAARRIDTLFRLARDSAARSGVAMAVAIDSASGAVWLLPERVEEIEPEPFSTRRPTPPAGTTRRSSGFDAGESLELPATVKLELGTARARFLFTPSGAAWGDTLVLRTTMRAMTITLDPWTGDAIAH
jgi:prepilin-type N-terminal cleavage/methylation domain-containing protein